MKLSIGVIFGGNSLEHELSILTAVQAMDNIDKERYEVERTLVHIGCYCVCCLWRQGER